MFAGLLLVSAVAAGASHHHHYGHSYYPHIAHFTCSAYPGCGAYAPYGTYAPYAPYACQGFSPYVGFDPHFSFGCYGSHGCYGFAQPAGCYGFAQPIVVAPMSHCWSGPIVIQPVPDEGKKPKDMPVEQKLDELLRELNEIKKAGNQINARLLLLEKELLRMKQAIPKPRPQPEPRPEKAPPRDKNELEETSRTDLQDRAVVLVQLPAEARLYLDDQPAGPTGEAQRTILTPALQPGARYSYTLRAEIVADGRTFAQTQTISFQAGQQVAVHFEGLGIPLEVSSEE